MSSVEPSEQIANLFTSFKENESAVEQLKSSLRKSTQMADQIQQKLHAQKEAVGKMDFEHLRLRKALMKSNEVIKTLDEQLQNEKDLQIAAFSNLVHAEDGIKESENDGLDRDCEFAQAVGAASTLHLQSRAYLVEQWLAALQEK